MSQTVPASSASPTSRQRRLRVWLAAAFGLLLPLSGSTPGNAQALPGNPALNALLSGDMQRQVAAATSHSQPWNGPRTGPAGQVGKTVAVLSEDLRNGGVLGVTQGVLEAAKVLQWTVKVFDTGGSAIGRAKASNDAFALRPDGLLLIGSDAREMAPRLAPFQQHGIPIVGWHVGAQAGVQPDSPVAINVSTDPLEVARITAMAAVVAARGKAGVVIFTDSGFDIAMAKARVMADVIRACQECTLLEMRDIPISRTAKLMPAVTLELLARHGRRWTHALAINDLYFDHAVPELSRAGQVNGNIQLLSAGDGSTTAFTRIQSRNFQSGTVAEPLNLHGWQLLDELNRLLAHQPVSGHVFPVHLVTPDNIHFDGGPRFQYDPANGYRNIYRQIWQR